MSIQNLGRIFYNPIAYPDLGDVSPSATDMLRSVVINSGFEAAKMTAAMATMPLALTHPLVAAFAMPLVQAGLQMGQNAANLSMYNQQYQGRDLAYSQYGQQIYPQPWDQRVADPYGYGGQYGYNQIAQQFPPQYPPVYPGQYQQAGTAMPYSMPIAASPVYGSNAATATQATINAGFAPSGNSTYDLANAIANAPTYSPTEMALLSKIKDPEQRAIQELQMQMQKQALLATVITNLANMRHEMLKAVAQNLRS